MVVVGVDFKLISEMLLLAKVERVDFTVSWQKGGREGKGEGGRERGWGRKEKREEGRQS